MNLHQLNTEARVGHVDELNLIAIEGGDFVLEARVKGKAHPLSDARGKRLKVHSVVYWFAMVKLTKQLLKPSMKFSLKY
mgnify:CR=1 FL=1